MSDGTAALLAVFLSLVAPVLALQLNRAVAWIENRTVPREGGSDE